MSIHSTPRAIWAARAALGLLVALQGCNLKEVTIPGLAGPSELGLALTMTANPDTLVANDVSSSLVTITVRDQNGHLVAGQGLTFAIFNDVGAIADLGSLSSPSAVTNGNGQAQVAYSSPARTDFLANSFVSVGARPLGTDFAGARYRTVTIELRAAETNLFPGNPNRNCITTPTQCPVASFVIEFPFGLPVHVGDQVLFQSTSHDTPDATGHVGQIVRFQWNFGDGTVDVKPDVNHAYRFAGTFTVTLVVTDSDGAQGFTSAIITVI